MTHQTIKGGLMPTHTPKFTIYAKNSPESQEAIQSMDSHFQQYGMDLELSEHLWHMPIASIYGKNGEPNIATTIKSQQDFLLSERDHNDVANIGFELFANKMGISVDELIALDKMLITSLFTGVNKSLSVPIVVRDFDKSQCAEATTLTTAYSMAYLVDEDHVAFSVKNICKHYGWGEVDAKAFYRNVRSNGLFSGANFVRLVKPKSDAYFRNVFVSNFSEPLRYMWSFSQNIAERSMVMFDMSSDYGKALELTDRPLPRLTLNAWKDVCKRRFERLNPSSSWDDLSVADQKRRLVNLIRHNSVSYVDSWANANPEHISHLHAISFERTLKKISTAYPYLSEECKRQMNTRNIPLNPELKKM